MKKNGWLILAAFLGGILLANLSKKELLTTYGILNTYFLNQYSYRAIDCDSLFRSVFSERMKMVVFLFLLGKIIPVKVFFSLVECFTGVTFGFLMVVAIVNLGMRGIAVTLCGMFPQWLFYIAAFFFCALYQKKMRYPVWHGKASVKETYVHAGLFAVVIFLILAGVVAESYVNPVFLGKMLKIF